MVREICFDTETTGLDPYNGDRLIEIGCVEIVDGKITDNDYHILINPERDVPEDAVKIHHITTEMLADKPKFPEIVDGFLDFIKDSKLVAHNSNFDIKFINYELSLIGKEHLTNEVLDSLVLAQSIFPNQKNNLDALCKRFNIDNTKRAEEGHGALLDAQLLAEVYLRMNIGFQEKFTIENKQSEEAELVDIDILVKNAKNNKLLEKRNFPISEEELKIHNEFLIKNIKGNLWGVSEN